jgi:hypothetical protein
LVAADVPISIPIWERPNQMPIRLTKSGPISREAPTITFAHLANVRTLARLLDEHRGHHNPRDRFHSLVYSFLIYDHYAEAYKRHTNHAGGIRASWLNLANNAIIQDIYATILHWTDQSRIGDIEFALPITSVSPFHHGSAPQGIAAGTYALETLSCEQFIQIAWVVRCNLLHGSYDPCKKDVELIILQCRPLTALVWQILLKTQE